MFYDTKEMLRKSVIPVLLGDCAAAHALSFRIYFRCGVVSYVCDENRRISDYLNPFSRFFSLICQSDDDVICDALDYLSSKKDYLPVIIPCSDRFRTFVNSHRDFLESRFIIATPETIFKQTPMSIFQ